MKIKLKFNYVFCLFMLIAIRSNSQNNNSGKEFVDYINKYKDGCDNKEGLEWIGFCIIDLKQHKKYLAQKVKSDSSTVFFQFHYKIKNFYLIEYRIWEEKSEYFAYFIYNSSGRILDHLKIKTENEVNLRSKETSFSEKDTLLKVISFDPIDKSKLDHKFFAPIDASNSKIKLYSIKKGKFLLKEARNIRKSDW